MPIPERTGSVLRPIRSVFESRSAQRGSVVGDLGDDSSKDRGPGAYNPHLCAVGHPFRVLGIHDGTRQNYSFKSTTVKGKMPRPLTANVDSHVDVERIRQLLPSAPGTKSTRWPKGERKPPFFHPPFRAYPLESGDPRGREKGLDIFYEIDSTSATPIALNGTLEVNMRRHPRKYAGSFKSKQPSRPQADARGGSGDLGPGSYDVPKSQACIKIFEPHRPSSGFMRYSGGMYRGVGVGTYEEWLMEEPKIDGIVR